MRLFAIISFLLIGLKAAAQEPIVTPIETFPVNATLISPLQGSINRGIIRIDRIEANPYNLAIGDTLLVRFYFSLKRVKGEKDLVGIQAGDKFSARMAAQQNNLDGSYFYQVFHYKNISYLRDPKRKEALTSDESQK